jgi:hypothetical protein
VTLFENQVGGEEDLIREIRLGNIRAGKGDLHVSDVGQGSRPKP